MTGAIARYPMPDARARDPHTPVFDSNGTLWFTVQGGNFVGKLDPASGEIALRQPPTLKALPYGIVISPEGVPYFCEFGVNKIGRVDPSSLEITEYTVTEGARPRRLTMTPDGLIYYGDYARGFLGRLDPSSRAVREWPSPGGDRAEPYGITSSDDGSVWYSESGVEPNTLVRFDPRTESFQSWPIPSGGGVVRNMVATADGRLYLACSGVNKIGIATVTATE
jgi:virginiamycin B lyase